MKTILTILVLGFTMGLNSQTFTSIVLDSYISKNVIASHKKNTWADTITEINIEVSFTDVVTNRIISISLKNNSHKNLFANDLKKASLFIKEKSKGSQALFKDEYRVYELVVLNSRPNTVILSEYSDYDDGGMTFLTVVEADGLGKWLEGITLPKSLSEKNEEQRAEAEAKMLKQYEDDKKREAERLAEERKQSKIREVEFRRQEEERQRLEAEQAERDREIEREKVIEKERIEEQNRLEIKKAERKKRRRKIAVNTLVYGGGLVGVIYLTYHYE